ncbi:MAG: HAD-IA family hydrolase [Actinobacteria bacterium]|nr:HAD-IA family hydrolase [Actinomycetota bacterium]
MVQSKPIKAVLFDLGNTLLDFELANIERIFELGSHRVYDYLQQKGCRLPSFNNYHRRQLRRILWRVALARLIRRDFNGLDTLRRISLSMGHNLTRPELEEMVSLWYDPLSNTARVAEELREVLDWLTKQNLKLGIISNTFVPGVILDGHLAREGLLDYFPVRIYSCDTKFRKPSRKIFRLALEKLSCPAQQVVFVGDVPRMDIRGARRLGMIGILKDYNQPRNFRDRWLPFTKPDFTITHMRQLKEIVAKLLAPVRD